MLKMFAEHPSVSSLLMMCTEQISIGGLSKQLLICGSLVSVFLVEGQLFLLEEVIF